MISLAYLCEPTHSNIGTIALRQTRMACGRLFSYATHHDITHARSNTHLTRTCT
jgi:hypothetical protein